MREDEQQQKRPADRRCLYNDAVRCEDARRLSHCPGCGWNPRVQAKRKRRRREDGG